MAHFIRQATNATTTAATEPIDTLAPHVVAVAIPFTIAIILIVSLRFYVRIFIVRRVGADDWTILLATVGGILLCAVSIAATKYGLGRFMRDIPPQWFEPGLKLGWINQMIYNPTVAVVKISICLFLLRLAPTSFYRTILWSTLAFMATYTCACTLNIAFQCTPAYYYYDRSGEGHCMSTPALIGVATAHGVVNILTDVVLVSLPIPMLWNVQISMKQKIAIWATLSVGLFGAAASIIKLTFIVDYKAMGTELFRSVNLTMWSIIEIDTGIIVASIPALKPLFKKFLDASGMSYGGSNGRSGGGLPGVNSQSIGHKLQSFNNTSSFSKGGEILSSNESQEEIIPGHNTIRKTTEIAIDVQETGSIESSNAVSNTMTRNSLRGLRR